MLVDIEKINEAKEKLGDRNAQIIAETFGVEKWDERNHKGLCPFHLEDTPSFIYNSKVHKCRCFGCGKVVDVIDAYMYTGKTYMQALQELFKEADVHYSFGELGVKTKPQYKYPHEEPINDKSHVYEYLGKRGISKETIDYADVREDCHGNIVFNYRNSDDVLCLVKYRPSRKIDKSKGDIKAWCQKDADTMPLLFNMNKVNVSSPLLITEGEIDSLAAIEAGWTNVVSVPLGANNYGWIEENFEWLEQFDNIIICSDNDEAGAKMQKECVFRLGSWKTKFIDIPKFHTKEDGTVIPMKDLNEVLYYEGKQAVMDLISNAKDPGVPSVVDLSEVQDIELDEMDGIDTGIRELDSEIMKLFYGTLTVISGTPGSGKTSFLSQVACHALEQNKPVWMFSREMPGWMERSWLNYILAGGHHIKTYRDRNDSEYYKVTQEAKEAISKSYSKQWFLYRDDWSNKIEDLMKSMEDSVRKYGTKLLILDNLMTIDLDGNENNYLMKQTDCINGLIKFAMKYSVAVVLVAHPRKMPNGVDVGIYDVSGSSNISNLAHRTIGLRRINNDSEKSDYNVCATIIKDRMCGRSGKKINMYYDVPSRRFYTNEEEYNYQYRWDRVRRPPLPYPHADVEEVIGVRI